MKPKKDPLDELIVEFHVRCEVCKKSLGHYKKGSGHGYKVEDGTIQTGQGFNKPLLTFCNKKCFKKWEKKQ